MLDVLIMGIAKRTGGIALRLYTKSQRLDWSTSLPNNSSHPRILYSNLPNFAPISLTGKQRAYWSFLDSASVTTESSAKAMTM